MFDPATIVGALVAYFGAHWMDNIVSAEIHDLGHHLVHRMFRAIDDDVDERSSHDIARTVRLAQIDALEKSLDGFTRFSGGGTEHDQRLKFAFIADATSFYREQRRLAKANPGSLAIPVLEPLQAATDGVLAPVEKGSEARAYADAIELFAETAVLDELRQQLKVPVPCDFDVYLKHGANGDHPRFLSMFGDEIREAVKSNQRYRDILLASGISEIKERGFETTEILLRLERRFGIDSIGLRAAVDRIDIRTERIEAAGQRSEGMLAEVLALVRHLAASNRELRQSSPEPNLLEAAGYIADGARDGDTRFVMALDFLRAERVDDAVPLLRAFAEDKRARAVKDNRAAAAAYRNLGIIAGLRDSKAALDAYAMAVELDPDDLESLYWAGSLALDRGELGIAETRLRRLFSLAGDDDHLRFWAQIGLGDVQVARGNLPAALTSYQASLAIADRMARADLVDAEWQHELSASQEKIGDVQRLQGDLLAALTSYQASLAIADRMARADPGNTRWQRDQSMSHNRIGDVQQARGNRPAVLTSYQASFAIADRMARSDPGNMQWQRDLSMSHLRIGGEQRTDGDLQAALTSYRASLAIADRLARSDPGNMEWQRDLSLSQEMIGNIQVEQGNLPAALASYQASLAIADRLARAAPGNAERQRDLSVSHGRIGDVQRAEGDLPAALTSYQATLAIRERLVVSDPGNAVWQRDLALIFGRIAEIYAQQGRHDQAVSALRRGRDIIERLVQQSPDDYKIRFDLIWFNQWRLYGERI
jgi:tetratricopeptide (TPR) repeat protein